MGAGGVIRRSVETVIGASAAVAVTGIMQSVERVGSSATRRTVSGGVGKSTIIEGVESGVAPGAPFTLINIGTAAAGIFQVVGRMIVGAVGGGVTRIDCGVGTGQASASGDGGIVSVAWVGAVLAGDTIPVLVQHNGSVDGDWDYSLAVTRLSTRNAP